jgi:hypothetical protein
MGADRGGARPPGDVANTASAWSDRLPRGVRALLGSEWPGEPCTQARRRVGFVGDVEERVSGVGPVVGGVFGVAVCGLEGTVEEVLVSAPRRAEEELEPLARSSSAV